MEGTQIITAILALVFVLALIMLISLLFKRLNEKNGMVGKEKRLSIVESRNLDPKRRLVLVRRDDKEHLLLLTPSGETVVESGLKAPKLAQEVTDV